VTKIKKPLKQDFCNWPQDPLERAKLFWFNRQLVSCRQAVEWGMRSLQGSFGWLRIPMHSDNAHFRQLLHLVICQVHQLQKRLVGINQIKNVYERVWRESGLYDKFEQMVFGDTWRSYRIEKFYNLVL
jgi:hypothetical protein